MSGIIDPRDLVKELDEVRDEIADIEKTDAGTAAREEDRDELATLREREDALAECIEELPSDALDGEPMIPEDEFEDYARQLAEDIGAISSNASWPLSCIDWSRAADQLRADYMTVEYDGDDYLVRA